MKHAALLICVTAIVAVVLGGCGGGSSSPAGGQVAAPASEVTDWTTQPITVTTQDGRAAVHGTLGGDVVTADLSTG